ncbi:uncharacterized protein LOC135808448 [Sycon ciliatum]|uniref:uncharacterized protein LOC135808448 n=1 Tax=Sycon ciliatum TaxID=27933 RepID=UPI0031F6E576
MRRDSLLAVVQLTIGLAHIVNSQTAPPAQTGIAAVCTDPGIPDYGYRHGSAEMAGAVISFGCDNGFELHGATVRRCTYNAELGRSGWSGVQPICEHVRCPVFQPLRNGNVEATRRTFKSVVRFSCDKGYELSDPGAESVTCTWNGLWSKTIPTCEPISCGEPESPLPRELERVGDSFTHSSTVKYRCASRQQSIEGDSKRTCQETGEWTGSTPRCKSIGIECVKPRSIADGSWEVSRNPVANYTMITYYCDDGFTLRGQSKRVCYSNATWSGDPPVCIDLTDVGTGTATNSSAAGNPVTTEYVTAKQASPGLFQRIPILVGIIASIVVLMIVALLVAMYIARKRKSDRAGEKGAEKPAIYANSALFSPTREEKVDPGKRMSITSSKAVLVKNTNAMDDISEESSQMSSVTPPLPPPPQPSELLDESAIVASLTPLSQGGESSPANGNGHSKRMSTGSLGALAAEINLRHKPNQDHRRSEPLPVLPKPSRPPHPPSKQNRPALLVSERIEESEDGDVGFYDDTLAAAACTTVPPHRGTMSKRPAAPLPKPVTKNPSLNPLEKLFQKNQDHGEEDNAVVARSTAIMPASNDIIGCYSGIDGDEENEEHLYEPAPCGWGNRLSLSYDDVDSEEEGQPGAAASTLGRGNTFSKWSDLHSDMAAIQGHLDSKSNTLTSQIQGVPMEEYDSPADAINRDGRSMQRTMRRTPVGAKTMLQPPPPPIPPGGIRPLSTIAQARSTIHTSNSSSSLQSNDYHLPIDATNPISFTAVAAVASRYHDPYDVPLESIAFEESIERDYAVPVDCPGSGGNSLHSSQKRINMISTKAS